MKANSMFIVLYSCSTFVWQLYTFQPTV